MRSSTEEIVLTDIFYVNHPATIMCNVSVFEL